MAETRIEWADVVWNPVTGCSKVSEGCRYCYAETQAKRFWGERKFTEVRCHEDRLETPLSWKKPRRVFVNSMSDLFHKDVPDSFIGKVFAVMAMAPQHTFMILTKRPERMYKLLGYVHGEFWETIRLNLRINGHEFEVSEEIPLKVSIMPLKNVWLGVSVEGQESADKRIPLLLETPAAVRFVSCEPLLGPIELRQWFPSFDDGLDWVIVGGESGRFARPVHPDWVRNIRNQCNFEHVPFFFKQWGEWEPISVENVLENKPNRRDGRNYARISHPSWRETYMARVGKKRAGRVLDGRTWDEFPGGGI